MRGLHLKQRGDWWYYQRRRPKQFCDVEPRSVISFALGTTDFAEAKLRAAQHSRELDRRWMAAKARGASFASDDGERRYGAAQEAARAAGFAYAPVETLDDADLIARLKALINAAPAAGEVQAPAPTQADQKAVLGVVSPPKLKLSKAFERFWEHIEDEWRTLSRDQRRVKRNAYLKSIDNFETAVGKLPLHEITRDHALAFRGWWLERISADGYKPHTANRQFSALRRLISVVFDIEASTKANPFARVRIKDVGAETRAPFETAFIRDHLLASGALDRLPEALRTLVRLLVNTGMRPSEAIGLELTDIDVAAAVPFVHVRRNGVRSLKTDHSERRLPLVGVSLAAAEALVAAEGWGKWAGKNMYATTAINKHFRDSALVTDPKQSLYSLRHWFQDQLTKRDVVDRAQAQLMGHKFQRPKYGYGKDLGELRAIVSEFAL